MPDGIIETLTNTGWRLGLRAVHGRSVAGGGRAPRNRAQMQDYVAQALPFQSGLSFPIEACTGKGDTSIAGWALPPMGSPYGKADSWKGRGNMVPVAVDWGIPGFDEALVEALAPFNGQDPQWNLEEMKNKIGQKIAKASKKFATDERVSQRGTATHAKALIEDFVDAAMGAVSAGCYDRPWFLKVNFAGPLLAAVLHTFQGAKIFTRTLAPMLERHVEEGLFKWAEEERLQRVMWEALAASGVKESYQKKANQHLQKAYDEAHIKAPYGSTTAELPQLALLQDFVKGWMSDFVGRAWDVLAHGVGSGSATRDEQILFLTVLFQNLTAAACLPHDLTVLIETPPPSPWAFIAVSAEAVFAEIDVAEEQAAKRRKSLQESKGWGKGQVSACA